MCGINLSPRALASRRGASGTAGRLLAGSPSAESASMAAPSGVPFTGRPRAADLAGPIEPTDPRKLAEAYAMATRRDHPLHHALMDRLHPDHARAVADYERLHEQAFAPRTAVRGKPAEAHPQTGAASLITPAEKPPATGLKRPLAGPALSPLPAQKPPAQSVAPIPPQKPAGSVKPERAAETPSSLSSMPMPKTKPDLVDEIIALDAKRGAEDRAKAESEMRKLPPPFRNVLPPRTYVVSPGTYEAMRDAIEAMPNLSPTERHVFMRILTYEGTRYDSAGDSKGGIRQSTWSNIKDKISEWRAVEGRNTPVPESVEDLAIEDMFEAMRAYAQQEFGSAGAMGRIADLELAFQLFDLQYQYGSTPRGEIWQIAIQRTRADLNEPRLVEQLLTFDKLVSDSQGETVENTPRERLNLATAISIDSGLSRRFIFNLQRAKSEWWLKMEAKNPTRFKYDGATRARIWGMIARH